MINYSIHWDSTFIAHCYLVAPFPNPSPLVLEIFSQRWNLIGSVLEEDWAKWLQIKSLEIGLPIPYVLFYYSEFKGLIYIQNSYFNIGYHHVFSILHSCQRGILESSSKIVPLFYRGFSPYSLLFLFSHISQSRDFPRALAPFAPQIRWSVKGL